MIGCPYPLIAVFLFTITVPASAVPQIWAGGVVNAAGFAPAPPPWLRDPLSLSLALIWPMGQALRRHSTSHENERRSGARKRGSSSTVLRLPGPDQRADPVGGRKRQPAYCAGGRQWGCLKYLDGKPRQMPHRVASP